MIDAAISLAILVAVTFVGIAILRLAEAQRRRADAELLWASRRDPMNAGVPVSPLRRGGFLIGGASAALILIQVLQRLR